MKTTIVRLTLSMLSLNITIMLTGLIAWNVQAEEVENLARNGDFEWGLVEWVLELHADKGANARLTIDKKDPHGGRNCAFLETFALPEKVNYYVGLQQVGHSIEKGETYTLSCWIKAEFPRSVEFLSAMLHEPWHVWGLKSVKVDETWKEYWTTFTAEETDPNARIEVWTGMAKGDVWVDDVRFYQGKYVPSEEAEGESVYLTGKLTTVWSRIKAAY